MSRQFLKNNLDTCISIQIKNPLVYGNYIHKQTKLYGIDW